MNGSSGTFDVAVAGGGVLGMSLAGFLAASGARVCVIDGGSGGGSTANAGSLHVQLQSRFSRKYPEKLPALERNLHLYPKAVAFWKKFEADLGANFDVHMTGGLMVAESTEQLDFLAEKSHRETRLGLDVRMLDRGEVEKIAPYLGPTVHGAEFCGLEGKANPLLANVAIRKWVIGLGVELTTNTNVGAVESSGSGYELVTPIQRIHADKVVLAAGGGNKALARALGLNLPVISEPLHMNITEPTRPIIGHLVQHADRPITLKQFSTGHVAIGGGWPASLRARDGYPTVELASMVGNTTLAQHIIPQLAPLCVIRTWAGINPTADGRPILGEFSAMRGVYAAVSGDAGFTLGPFSARLLADAILGHSPTEDMKEFSPDQYAGA
jgi:glycine/D-amino acid oxidase-like deaminating enzyme